MTQRATEPGTAVSDFLADASFPGGLGVAVSGGSDSLALLYLLADWASASGTPLHAVTVDHNLRLEAAAEAEFVARIAARLSVSHSTLKWDGPDTTGNLSDQARRARYALMANWARTKGIGAIALGHTADDQAETFLMRLARGSGVDGLARMLAHRQLHEVTFLRPLLSLRRDDLRNLLQGVNQPWIDDPTNDDKRYDRVRMRQMLPGLADLGLTIQALNNTAANLATARDALDHYCRVEGRRLLTQDQGGDITIPHADWCDLPDEIARRLMNAALAHMAGPGYPPRGRAVAQLMNALRAEKGMTLNGCLIQTDGKTFRITRETAAVSDVFTCVQDCLSQTIPPQTWDSRWRILGPFQPGDVIRATGEEGLSACPNWRETGLARPAMLAGPSVWRNDEMIAAPLAGYTPAHGLQQSAALHGDNFRANLIRGPKELAMTLTTH